MAGDALRTYMSDHLAGAAAGVEMLEHLIRTSEDQGERQFFETLHQEIDADRRTLEQLLERVGGHPSTIRQLGGWLSEKFIALKMRWDDPGGRRLDYFETIEGLCLGVLGKRALWRVLGAVADQVGPLQGMDFALLERRAQDQHDRLDSRRIAAGRRIFGGSEEASE